MAQLAHDPTKKSGTDQLAHDPTTIPGWGVDADPKNDPTYPMKRRTDVEQLGYTWERPPQQEATVEILHSNERPNLSAVFGTAAPPSGLSGWLRRFAFRYSESSYAHWLPLLLADRVNMVEGVIADLLHGHVPNIFAERGWRAEWTYNRKAFLLRVLGASAALAGAVALLRARGRSSR
jgi:hypothetical protein